MRTIWFGPVARNQVGAPMSDVFVQCTGDGSNGTAICVDIADTSGGLDALARKHGVPDGESLVLRGFSAGGHAIKHLLRDPAARNRVVAVHSADASYEHTKTGWDEGYVAYGAEAATGVPGRIFAATAGASPNPQGVTDSESINVLRQKIEERIGQPFAEVQLAWATRPPVHAWQLGRALLVDWGSAFKHGEHATALSKPVWENVIQPWLDNPITPLAEQAVDEDGASALSPVVVALGVAGALALGVAAWYGFTRRPNDSAFNTLARQQRYPAGWEDRPVDWAWSVAYKKPGGRCLVWINTDEKDVVRASVAAREIAAADESLRGYLEYGHSKVYFIVWEHYRQPILQHEYAKAKARGHGAFNALESRGPGRALLPNEVFHWPTVEETDDENFTTRLYEALETTRAHLKRVEDQAYADRPKFVAPDDTWAQRKRIVAEIDRLLAGERDALLADSRSETSKAMRGPFFRGPRGPWSARFNALSSRRGAFNALEVDPSFRSYVRDGRGPEPATAMVMIGQDPRRVMRERVEPPSLDDVTNATGARERRWLAAQAEDAYVRNYWAKKRAAVRR